MATITERLLARADDDHPALLFGEQAWRFRQLMSGSKPSTTPAPLEHLLP